MNARGGGRIRPGGHSAPLSQAKVHNLPGICGSPRFSFSVTQRFGFETKEPCLVSKHKPRPMASATERLHSSALFVLDDMGAVSVGAYGGHRSTPHMDDMAAKGRRYEYAYSMPACAPTRLVTRLLSCHTRLTYS